MAGASAVKVKRAAAQSRVLDTTPDTVVGVTGITQRGPIGVSMPCSSFGDFEKIYGDFLTNSEVPLQVKGIFDEAGDGGGVLVNVNRIVHFGTPGDPTTKTSAAASLNLNTANVVASAGADLSGNVGPYALAVGQTIAVAIDGGGTSTATVAATAASRTSGAGAFALSNGQTLQIAIDGGATFTKTFATSEFNSIGAATAAEVVAALNAFFAGNGIGAVASVSTSAVKITSNRLGTGSGVNIVGGTANSGELAFTVGNVAGTGNVSNLAAVTAAELATMISGAVAGCAVTSPSGKVLITSNTTGASSSVQVTSASTAVAIGFDNAVHAGLASGTRATLTVVGKTDGTHANAYSLLVAAPSSSASTEKNFQVLDGGVVAEEWFNLSLDPTSPRYWPTVINEGGDGQPASNLIAVTDLLIAVPSPNNLPANGSFGPMTGGNDGLVGIADADWTGGATTNGSTGLRVLDTIEDLAAILCPGRATAAVHNGMVNYCEVVRGGLCFAVLDTPAGLTYDQMITYVVTTAQLQQSSELVELNWPRISIDNPNTAIYGTSDTILVGPSGAYMGMCARLDQSKPGGAFEQPASQAKGVLTTARGLESDDVKNAAKRGLIFDALINPITSKRGTAIYVDGARTLKSTGPFPSVGESRGVLFVQITLTQALDPERNQNIRARLYNEIDMDVQAFLKALTAAECFVTKVDADAWYFDIGSALNTPAVQAARDVEARLGLATSEPAEFINIVIAPFRQAATA